MLKKIIAILFMAVISFLNINSISAAELSNANNILLSQGNEQIKESDLQYTFKRGHLEKVQTNTGEILVVNEYDEYGMRKRKIGNVESTFIYDSNKNLVYENRNGIEIEYEYNYEKGLHNIESFKINQEKYFYEKDENLMIIGISDVDHNLLAKYEYVNFKVVKLLKLDGDVWCECTDSNFIGNINKIRNTFSYYDEETDMYYGNGVYTDATSGFVISPNSSNSMTENSSHTDELNEDESNQQERSTDNPSDSAQSSDRIRNVIYVAVAMAVLLCVCTFSLLLRRRLIRNANKEEGVSKIDEGLRNASGSPSEIMAEYAGDAVDDSLSVWGSKPETIEIKKVFQASDIKDSGRKPNSSHEWIEWEHGTCRARVEALDLENMLITYKSDYFDIKESNIDSAENLSSTVFYEEDINNDGKPELLLSVLQGTGDGFDAIGLYIFDEKQGLFREIFEKSHFNDKQKEEIIAVIEEWNRSGFLQACDREIEDLTGGEIFKPSLVKCNERRYNNQTKIQVEYDSSVEWRKTNTTVNLFALFGIDKDNTLALENLWCEIKLKK